MRDPHVDRRWAQLVAACSALAAYVGLTYAVATSPVIGANIGGGFLLLLGFVLVPVLCALILIVAYQIWRHPRPALPGGPIEPAN